MMGEATTTTTCFGTLSTMAVAVAAATAMAAALAQRLEAVMLLDSSTITTT